MELNAASPFNLVENAWDLKKLMLMNKLVMVYSDRITSNSFEFLMQLAEDKLQHLNTNLKNKKKILHILVEAIQNIAQHGHKDKNNTVASLFVIGMDDEHHFFVLTGNTIPNSSEPYLRDKLDHLNSLSAEELRNLHKKRIQSPAYTAKGGAGLGFIDMMRKAKSKIDYYFATVDKDHKFFTYKVNIADNDKEET